MSNLSIYENSKTLTQLSSDETKEFFTKILRDDAEKFHTFIMSTVAASKELQVCTASSLVGVFLKSKALNLPLDSALGLAYIVPYSGMATLQIGYKAYIQLAIRSGAYQKMNAVDVRKGEIIKVNDFTETYEFQTLETDRDKAEIIGYYGYFKLHNGFSKEVYWSMEKLIAHARKYSKTFNSSGSPWKTNLDAMCKKTVLRQLISKWGILSTEMQQAYKSDMGIIEYDKDGNEYVSYCEPEKDIIEIINEGDK